MDTNKHEFMSYAARSGRMSPFRAARRHVDHIGDVVYSDYYSRYYLRPFIKGHLYDESVIGTGALLIGAEVPLSCHWSLGLRRASAIIHSLMEATISPGTGTGTTAITPGAALLTMWTTVTTMMRATGWMCR